MSEFLGHSPRFWLALEAKLTKEVPDGPRLLTEIIELRAKVNFYESRIKEMIHVMGAKQ